jgi:hypothetical protein
MKLLFSFSAVLLLLATFSCKEVDKLLTFYIEDEQSITVPAQTTNGFPLGALIPLSPVAVNTNSETEFENNDTRTDLVKNVKLDKLTLTLTDPNQNFDFLKDVEIFISTDSNDELKVAYLYDIPTGKNQLELIPTGENLDKYVKASSYKIRTAARLRKAITNDVVIRAGMRFKVTADPL